MKSSLIYLMLLLSFPFSAVMQNLKLKTGKERGKYIIDSLIASTRKVNSSGLEERIEIGQPYSFNPSSLNYERYRNSPCYSKFGFDPHDNNEAQERRYCECEKQYYWGIFWKVAISLCLLTGIGFLLKVALRKKE